MQSHVACKPPGRIPCRLVVGVVPLVRRMLEALASALVVLQRPVLDEESDARQVVVAELASAALGFHVAE